MIKRGKYYFGYKGFVLADVNKEFISKAHVTPANQGESPELPKMMEDVETKRLMTDKAYDSKKNRQFLKSRSTKDGIMYGARKNHPLRPSQKKFNRLIFQKRFKIEQGFGTYAFTGVTEKSIPLFSLSRNRVPPKNSEKKGDTAEHDSCCSPKYT